MPSMTCHCRNLLHASLTTPALPEWHVSQEWAETTPESRLPMRAFRERAQRKWFKSALSKLKKKRLEPSQQSSCCPKAGLWERAVTAPLSKDPVSSECSPKPNLPTPPAQLVLGNKRHPTPKGKWIYKPMPRLYGDERKCRLNKKKTFFLHCIGKKYNHYWALITGRIRHLYSLQKILVVL